MKYLFALTLAIMYCLPACAQKSQEALIDSLLFEIKKAGRDTNKIKLLNNLSFTCNKVNPNDGLKYGLESYALADELEWKKGLAGASHSIAANYYYKSDYPKAIEYFFKALKINEELNDTIKIAEIFGNIGNVYGLQGNNSEALEYYNKALKIFEKLNKKEEIASELGNEGAIYYALHDYKMALECESKALKISRELDDKGEIAKNLGNLGNVYAALADYDNALAYDDSALNIYKELGDRNSIAINLGNIGETYLQIGKSTKKNAAFLKAIDYLTRAIIIDKEIGDLNNLKEFSQYLSECYELMGDYKNALENYKEFTLFNDSVSSISSKIKINNLENQRALDIKDEQIKINKLEVSKKRNESLFLMSGIFILLFVIIFITLERKKSESLLLNILPAKIAKRLRRKEHPIADYFSNVSILFIDMAGFTEYSKIRDPKDTVNMLNDVFTRFDALAEKYGLEKIKTIGDCYMAVCGLPEPRLDHAIATAQMALEIKESMKEYKAKDGTQIFFRFGIDCGPVVAGVIGKKKFVYDLWGDAVNTASRMEASGIANEIHCTDTFKKEVEGKFQFVSRGKIEIKGKGEMQTWLLTS
jgi:adenylate cyclase